MAAATGAVLAAGTSAYLISQSEKRKRDAKRELSTYERETLDNPYEELPLSMEGYDYLQDENARAMATAVDTLRGGGIRGAIGGAPRVVAAGNDLNADIARSLDDQMNKRSYAIAGDNARIEGIRENRDNQNINALSSQIMASNQDTWNGIMGLGSALAYGARSYSPSPNPQVSAINASPAGMATIPTPLPNASPYGFNTPYSAAPATPINPNDIYGDSFMYDDMINKY